MAERYFPVGTADPMNLIWVMPAEGSSHGTRTADFSMSQAASLRRDVAFFSLSGPLAVFDKASKNAVLSRPGCAVRMCICEEV